MFRVPLALEQLPVWGCVGAVQRASYGNDKVYADFPLTCFLKICWPMEIEVLGKKIGETQTKRQDL